MLILDTNKAIPLNMSMFDFDPAHIFHDAQTHIINFTLNNNDITQAVPPLAYDISSRCGWYWPDLTQTTVAFEIDYSRTFLRYSLRVGVQPQESPIETEEPDLSPEWAEFEAQRHEAVQAHIRNGSLASTDSFPVLLNKAETEAITQALYKHLGVF